jgi:hypothetical protein
MDVVLIILGVLGLGAIVTSAYVFTVAARNYVSDDDRRDRQSTGEVALHSLVARNPSDRRSGRPVAFPLTVNGLLIANDRRTLADRRLAF